MNTLRVAVLLFTFAVAACRAEETNALPTKVTIGGETYEDVTWGTVTPQTVTIRHKTGIATIRLEKLPPELQRRFGYTTRTAGETTTNDVAEAKPVAELADLKSHFESGLATIDNDEQARLNQAKEDYLTLLANMNKEATASGDLDEVLLIKAERERVASPDNPAVITEKSPQALWKARLDYWESCTNIIWRAAVQRATFASPYIGKFADLKVRLTQQEELGNAVLARKKEALARELSSKLPELPPNPSKRLGTPFLKPVATTENAAHKAPTAAGVGRIGIAAFNVAGSPFGEYDKAVIRTVQQRWYTLISQNGLQKGSGTVTLHFYLMQDGSVKDMEFKENSAGDIPGFFCQKAVVDSSPFASLPEGLRALVGNEPRGINFTFYY